MNDNSALRQHYTAPTRENTCCVIVTYHPDDGFASRLARIVEQVASAVIVDNASSDAEVRMMREIASVPGVHLIENDHNAGQAHALNQGLSWAKQHGYGWALTLDQDTPASDHIVESYRKILEEVADREKVAVIGSNFIGKHFGSGLVDENLCRFRDHVEVVTVITSGSLMSVAAADSIGAFRDEFFIDHVDDEYCLRARSKGYRILMSCEPLIEHTIGEPKMNSFLRRTLLTTNASAERRYYIARNFTVIYKEYRHAEREWFRHSLRVRLKEIVLMLMFEDRRFRKLWKTVRGVVDGLVSRF